MLFLKRFLPSLIPLTYDNYQQDTLNREVQVISLIIFKWLWIYEAGKKKNKMKQLDLRSRKLKKKEKKRIYQVDVTQRKKIDRIMHFYHQVECITAYSPVRGYSITKSWIYLHVTVVKGMNNLPLHSTNQPCVIFLPLYKCYDIFSRHTGSQTSWTCREVDFNNTIRRNIMVEP